jgi:hypothetical protein
MQTKLIQPESKQKATNSKMKTTMIQKITNKDRIQPILMLQKLFVKRDVPKVVINIHGGSMKICILLFGRKDKMNCFLHAFFLRHRS